MAKRAGGCMSVLTFFFVLSVLGCGGLLLVGVTAKREPTPTVAATPDPLVASRLPAIPGLMPVDVYLNMEQKGFTVSKRLGGTVKEWNCSKSIDGLPVNVNATGYTPSSVSEVFCMAAFDPNDNRPVAGEVLGYVATLPYDGSKPDEARQWVADNWNTGGTITIGKAKLELQVLTNASRSLRIVAINN